MSFLDRILAEGLTAFGKIQLQTSPPKVRAVDCRRLMASARPGMLICRKYNCYLDSLLIPGEYTHSGIIESPESVIHAVAEGVERIDILDFVKDCDGFILLCCNNGCQYSAYSAVQYGRNQVGKPYDFAFEAEVGKVSAFFCHELTARSLEAGGVKIIPQLKTVGPVTHEVYLAGQFIDDIRISTVYRTQAD